MSSTAPPPTQGTLATAQPTRTVEVTDLPTWQRLPRLAAVQALRLSGFLGVTRAGWTTLAIAILGLVLGGWLHWTELMVAAVVVVAVLLIGFAFTLGQQTYAVRLDLQTRRVVAGERAFGELVVENTSERRLLPARIELPVGRRLAAFGLPSLGPRAAHDEVFAVPTSRREVITVGPARTVRGDPFRLMGREIRWTEAVDLFVHPRTVTLLGTEHGFIRDLEGQPSTQLSASDISFHALREYVPGDDRRNIHWRSSARTGQLMVRQYEETRRSHVLVALDTAGEDWLSDDEFETGVSVVGSIAVQALRDENTLTVTSGLRRLQAATPRRTLDELCRVHLVNTGSIGAVTRSGVRTVPDASLAVVVTGSMVAAADLRRACSYFDVDTTVVAIRIDPDAAIEVQTLANVTVIVLPTLEALPSAIRRAGTR